MQNGLFKSELVIVARLKCFFSSLNKHDQMLGQIVGNSCGGAVHILCDFEFMKRFVAAQAL